MWLLFSGFCLRTQNKAESYASPHNSGQASSHTLGRTLPPSAVSSLTLRAAHQPNSFGVLRRAQDERKEFEMIERIPFTLRLSKHSVPFFSNLLNKILPGADSLAGSAYTS